MSTRRGGRWAAGLVIGAFALTMPGAAGAAFPGENGKIAFSRSGSLWVAHADGKRAERLVKGGRSGFPSFSPDGRRIAFQRADRDNTDIWIVDADGSRLRQLTDVPGIDGRPSFSADGRRIVFESERRGAMQVYVMKANGAKVKPLSIPSFVAAPQLSSTGSLVFGCTGASSNLEICTARRDGTDVRQLTDDIEAGHHLNPSWSPDGTRIVFTAQPNAPFDVFAMNADGFGVTQLTANAESGRSVDDDEAAFSPDGRKIIFEANRVKRSRNDIWVMNADGSGQTRLISNGSAPDWGPARR